MSFDPEEIIRIGMPTPEFTNLILFMLLKRAGGLVNFTREDFEAYDLQRVRFGFERLPEGTLNVFLIEGE